MKRFVLAAAACTGLVGCGGDPGDSATTPKKLAFERWSPPQHTSRDLFLAARGDVVVMANRISRDVGATWAPLPAQLGALTRVAIVGTTVSTFSTLGLTRWNLATDAITPIAGAPSYVTDRGWRADPLTGQFIAFEGVENAIAVERGGTWVTSQLPQPTSTEVRPYVRDLESNGTTLLTISVWGVHRSTDGGASWQLVTSSVPDAGRDLLVLADKRFLLVGGTTSYLFDASGQPAGTVPMLAGDGEAAACDDGAIVARGRLTRDLGASWHTLISGGDLTMTVDRVGCGGGRYWMLAHSEAWGYRLVRYDTQGTYGVVVGNWETTAEPAWANGGPPIVLTTDGTFLVAGLAWREGDVAWSLREIPARTWESGSTLFGVVRPSFYTSLDAGQTWKETAATGLTPDQPEAFARTLDGTLLVSQFTGETTNDGVGIWRSTVWNSTDGGAAWTVAYQATATRAAGDDEIIGEVHRFVGLNDTGEWIATDAVSRDNGLTWDKTDVVGERSLAHLTRHGTLVAVSSEEDVWRAYDDGGLGELRATFQIEVNSTPIPASQLQWVAFDDLGFAYVARGAPYVQVWRSAESLDVIRR